MLAVPGPTAAATPPLPTVATAGLSEVHLESAVMTWVVLSLNRPVAVKDALVPGAMVFPDGVTTRDTMVALVTSSVVVAVMEPDVAVMVVVPGARPFARPEPAILATVVSDEVQLTEAVMERVLPSV